MRNNLNYYGKQSFLKGMILRSGALLDSDMPIEAAHYMARTLIEMLESYMWLRSVVEGKTFDYTMLVKSLWGVKETPSKVYEDAVKVLGLEETPQRGRVESIISRAKEIIIDIRKQRKDLIRKNVKPAS